MWKGLAHMTTRQADRTPRDMLLARTAVEPAMDFTATGMTRPRTAMDEDSKLARMVPTMATLKRTSEGSSMPAR